MVNVINPLKMMVPVKFAQLYANWFHAHHDDKLLYSDDDEHYDFCDELTGMLAKRSGIPRGEANAIVEHRVMHDEGHDSLAEILIWLNAEVDKQRRAVTT